MRERGHIAESYENEVQMIITAQRAAVKRMNSGNVVVSEDIPVEV